MKVGFTGTRKGMSTAQLNQLRCVLYSFKEIVEFHHGGAEGADRQADSFVSFGEHVPIVLHPCPGVVGEQTIGRSGRSTYNGHDVTWREVLPPLVRNRNIVGEADVLIAAPEQNEETTRSGTWATVRYARRKHIPVIMLSR
jgi:hypothetical protein